ncbi:hypothetical protein KC19_9G057400 [Ceratodon purpureus]|uniref:PGG domain-containing protein n=1 Tax=Ceratodon purpureus TaxID=3225 RepID=A0A8T0GP32_CERPU|nr:hypothetical protein KC19_9G057400 [Ceratodon purpureus]
MAHDSVSPPLIWEYTESSILDQMTHPNSNPVDVEIDDEWIDRHLDKFTAKSISERACLGDFALVEELMQELDRSGGKKLDFIEVIPNLMMSSTCEKTKRTLIHWAALHNKPSILTWILFESGGTKFCYPGSFLNGQDIYGYTALHLAVEANHVEMVKILLTHTHSDVSIAAQNMRACGQNKSQSNGLTPLHFAARNGSLPIVKMLLESKENNLLAMSAKSTSLKTVLHYAAEGGNWQVVRYLLELLNKNGMGEIVNQCDVFRQTPLYLAALNGNVEILEIFLREGQCLNINTVTWEGMTALDVAKRKENLRKENIRKEIKELDNLKKSAYLQLMEETKQKHQRIVDMLESYDVNWLQAERQKYANAANCLLVGAALVAGVTYAGWLQPPLGFTQYYAFPTSDPAAPPGTFESYVGVEQHSEIQMFWFFNSMSFFCSVATFIIGADAGIPDKCSSLRDEVVQLRNSVVRASFVLSVAILFVIGAFASAGILVLPPIQKQRAPMYVTIAVGVTLCLFLLTKFIRKLKRWFLSPSLKYKREAQPSGGCSNVGFTADGNIQGNVGLKSPDPSVGNAKLLDDHQNAPSSHQHSEHKPLEEQRHDGLHMASRPGIGSSVQRPFQGQLQAAKDFGIQGSSFQRPFQGQLQDFGIGSSVQRPSQGQLQIAKDLGIQGISVQRSFQGQLQAAKDFGIQGSSFQRTFQGQLQAEKDFGIGSSVQRPFQRQLQAAKDSEHSVERRLRTFLLRSDRDSIDRVVELRPCEEQLRDCSRPESFSPVESP